MENVISTPHVTSVSCWANPTTNERTGCVRVKRQRGWSRQWGAQLFPGLEQNPWERRFPQGPCLRSHQPPALPCPGKGAPAGLWDSVSQHNPGPLVLVEGVGCEIRGAEVRLCHTCVSTNVCWWDYLVRPGAEVKGQPDAGMLTKHSQFHRRFL